MGLPGPTGPAWGSQDKVCTAPADGTVQGDVVTWWPGPGEYPLPTPAEYTCREQVPSIALSRVTDAVCGVPGSRGGRFSQKLERGPWEGCKVGRVLLETESGGTDRRRPRRCALTRGECFPGAGLTEVGQRVQRRVWEGAARGASPTPGGLMGEGPGRWWGHAGHSVHGSSCPSQLRTAVEFLSESLGFPVFE